MKEYNFENGKEVDIEKLRIGFIDKDIYVGDHKRRVGLCHDIFIEYQGGILLVYRLEFPAKDELWPLGGGVKRGVHMEDSLREKVLEEASLELDDLKYLGEDRTFFQTDPFGHGKGTDTYNLVYFARGKGSLKLNKLHENPTIITPEDYQSYRDNLHPYVRDFMDLAILLVSRTKK